MEANGISHQLLHRGNEETAHGDSLVAQMDDTAEHKICCRVAKMVKISEVSQILVLVRALATLLQVVETHPRLMRQRLAVMASGLF